VPPGGEKTKADNLALDDNTVPADTHGVAYRRQTIRHSGHFFVGEIEGLEPAPSNGAEFHQWFIIACRLVTDRHVLGLVFVDEEHAT